MDEETDRPESLEDPASNGAPKADARRRDRRFVRTDELTSILADAFAPSRRSGQDRRRV